MTYDGDVEPCSLSDLITTDSLLTCDGYICWTLTTAAFHRGKLSLLSLWCWSISS